MSAGYDHYRDGRWFKAEVFSLTIQHGLTANHVIPPFQRGLVWDAPQKVKLIESILDGLPIGSYVVNQSPSADHVDGWLLDGQQRWDAIKSFVEDAFPVRGRRFRDFSTGEQSTFKHLEVFPAHITRFTAQEEARLRDIFERLAYGGTPNVKPEEQPQ